MSAKQGSSVYHAARSIPSEGQPQRRVTNNTMQHIPLPHNPTIGYIGVPCLPDQEYDGGDFETFPARQGYPDSTISEWKTLFDDPTADFVAFLQLWQYFGYIGSIFPFATSKILTKVREYGSRVVDTSNLITMVNHHVERTPEGYELQDGDLILRLKRSTKLLGHLVEGTRTPITTTTGTNSCLGSDVISHDPLMDGAIGVTMINNKAVELPVWTLWCLQ